MALVPFPNHWWHVTLRLTARGLTTGPMPAGDREVEIAFDLLDHRLSVVSSDGRERGFALGDRPACADFYSDLFAALDELGVEVEILAKPYDLDGPAFAEDRVHASYDPEAVTRFWRVWRRASTRWPASRPASTARRVRFSCSGTASTSRTPATPGARRQWPTARTR
jgi:hypothetical protein